jgi:hypothetical protein
MTVKKVASVIFSEWDPPVEGVVGMQEGEHCDRDGCLGTIQLHPPENCFCHLGGAPCSSCEDVTRMRCTGCGFAPDKLV